jgi:hypothetical protein
MAGTAVPASHPGAHFRNWGGLGIWSDGLDCHGIAWVRLSKTDDYLADNVSSTRLSDLGHRVNDKARFGAEAFENSPGEFVDPG